MSVLIYFLFIKQEFQKVERNLNKNFSVLIFIFLFFLYVQSRDSELSPSIFLNYHCSPAERKNKS